MIALKTLPLGSTMNQNCMHLMLYCTKPKRKRWLLMYGTTVMILMLTSTLVKLFLALPINARKTKENVMKTLSALILKSLLYVNAMSDTLAMEKPALTSTSVASKITFAEIMPAVLILMGPIIAVVMVVIPTTGTSVSMITNVTTVQPTVITMLPVQTYQVPFHVTATTDTLRMETDVQTLMNAEMTFVRMQTLVVLILMGPINVIVMPVIRATETNVLMMTNVTMVPLNVILTQLATIPTALSLVTAKMEKPARGVAILI